MYSQLLLCLTLSLVTLYLPVMGEETTVNVDEHNHHHHHDGNMDSMDSGHSMGHHMGMDMNGSDMDMSMMKGYFHTDLGDTLLFKDWILKTSSSTLVACIGFFILGVLYEGLKSYREFLITRIASRRCYSVSVITVGNGGGTGCPEACGPTSGDPTKPQSPTNIVSCKMWSWSHFYQSLLHILQVVVSYTLMLGFMSFNVWICLAIALGAGQGYFLFCWKRITVVSMTDHCN